MQLGQGINLERYRRDLLFFKGFHKDLNFIIVKNTKNSSKVFRCNKCNKFYSTRKSADKMHCTKCGCLRYI
jgi:hypothetical protein